MHTLVWFRSDLRILDNPALNHASSDSDAAVIGVFIFCPKQWKRHDWGDVKVDFVRRSVDALSDDLRSLHIPLLVLEVDDFQAVPEALAKLAQQHECRTICYNREYEVNEQARDECVEMACKEAGIETHSFHDQTVVPPNLLRTSEDKFYSVFSPYKRSWLKHLREEGIPEPKGKLRKRSDMPVKSDTVPKSVSGFDEMSESIAEMWPAGETAARKRLKTFVNKRIESYKAERDYPAIDATSTVSPFLAVGSISIRECLKAARGVNHGHLEKGAKGPDHWISELVWREFYRHVLVGFPHVCRDRSFRKQYDRFKWRNNEDEFEAWCEGRTGIPIVDAGIRQLRTIGWMHNRTRMIVAMFLTKNLLIDWRWGERFFMEHLIDGDFANNNGGWQWSASTGTDAAPYFRIFNPWTQGERFDEDGEYIRQYVPELKDVDDAKVLHDDSPKAASTRSDHDYPEPIVNHSETRARAIEAFKAFSG